MSDTNGLRVPEQHHVKRHSIHGITEEVYSIKPHQEIKHLSSEEKHYLLAVERGDVVTTKRYLSHNNVERSMGLPEDQMTININCTDPLGRSAILMAIDNENYEMLNTLVDFGVNTKDALLYAISKEFVEAVELLLDIEEKNWKPGEKHSWEKHPCDTTMFTSDITPLILAAHRDNYEIIKILLDKGACLPIPHDNNNLLDELGHSKVFEINLQIFSKEKFRILKHGTNKYTKVFVYEQFPHRFKNVKLVRHRCDCCECIESMANDSLQHSYSRINAYKALSSPCLIALSSKDPILTSFELSWALRRLSSLEHEFKSDYELHEIRFEPVVRSWKSFCRKFNRTTPMNEVWKKELKDKCQEFAVNLLDHTRSSSELEVLLNYDLNKSCIDDRPMRLERLKLAIKYKQKEFVVHPNVQQLLASIWYEGLPGFRKKNILLQSSKIVGIGIVFPIICITYMIAPFSRLGKMLRKPFIKFICHSASHISFLMLIMYLSFGELMKKSVLRNVTTFELHMTILMPWIFGLLWTEIRQLWKHGVKEYARDMWNAVDFITNSLYVAVISLQFVIQYMDYRELLDLNNRKCLSFLHPLLVIEALFSTANVLSALKLVYVFSINPYLGPLQIVLGRVILDIAKFFFVYVLVLFSFSCGLYHLFGKYSTLHKRICMCRNSLAAENNCNYWERITANQTMSDEECDSSAFTRFSTLFETTQTLFWAAIGLIERETFDIKYISEFTRFSGKLMFGTYCVISIVVLLNLLVAMMNHSYDQIFQHADVEWKFARSKLWISYFEEGGTLPVPFNIMPSTKSLLYAVNYWFFKLMPRKKEEKYRLRSMHNVVKDLVQRYVNTRQRRSGEHMGVTEDDINEIKQEISSFRSELNDILEHSGIKMKSSTDGVSSSTGKRNRFKERRLFRGLNMEYSMSSFELAETDIDSKSSMSQEDIRKLELKSALSELVHPILQHNPISKFIKKKKPDFQRQVSMKCADFGEESEDDKCG